MNRDEQDRRMMAIEEMERELSEPLRHFRGAVTAMAERAQIENPARRNADDIWTKCPSCKDMAFRKEVERNLNVCGKCGHHFRLTLAQRLTITVDRGSWREMFAEIAIGDPLEFVDSKPYPERLEQARRASGRNDAVVVGSARIEEHPVALAIMDFEFMGGSMGVVVGEKLARMIDHACAEHLPVVIFCASSLAKLGPERKQSRLWNSLGMTSLNTSESGMSVLISMPFEALTMTTSFDKNGENCFATERAV